ncbi:pre-rRNA processing protein [Coemansia sp. Benny D115]|nr:pre-rRNA processing protein [Coemansia sp. Benny D115]
MNAELEVQLVKLRIQVNSKDPHQRQHGATVLAVEETIKEQGMPVEPASYFATLLTLLEQTNESTSALASAIIYLLSLVLPSVSANTLRAKFTAMMAVLSQSLDLESADVALLKSVIACLETVLANQDAASWGQPIAQGTLKSLMALSIDSKPKIRKRAQQAVVNLLSNPPAPAVVHPAASTAVQCVLDALKNAKDDTQAALHILQLVKQTDMVWPQEAFEELCEALMNMPKLNTPFITTLSFQALERVFASATESLDEDQFRDILISIIDLKPSTNDPMASEAWLKIMQKGYTAYATISADACFQSLPDLIDLVFPDIELGKQSTREVATQCIWAMIRECIPDDKLESDGVAKIVKSLTAGLSYRYRESWTLIMLLIAAMFQRLGKRAHPVMDSLLVEISNMRMEPEFELKNEADAVLGAAVRAIGPQLFLEVLPLNLSTTQRKGDVGRAWLLPLMKGHIRNTELQFFVSTMLPLADELSAQSLQFANQGREIESKVFSALSIQVWALLNGFCNVPSDILEAFTPAFAERLANEMFESQDARPAICGALHTLLTAVHTIARSDEQGLPLTRQQAQAAEQHLARFAPDYLSQLFSIFAMSPGANRGYIMDTIKAFMMIISADEINSTFVKVANMLNESLKTHKPPAPAEMTERYLEANPPPNAHTMMDLATVMAPYLNLECSEMLLRAAFILAKQADDIALQKKGYRAINRLSEQPAESPSYQLIRSAVTTQLIPMLIESAETVAGSSRRERLLLIASISRELTDEQLHFVPAMLSEAILGTKEANERARNSAFETLLTMGRRMAQGGYINMSAITGGAQDDDDNDDEMQTQQQATIEEYFKMTAAGLAAQTPHMISATVAAMSRALFEFHELLSSEFIVQIMDTVLMFVVNNNREIAKASLGFVKVVAVVLPKEILLPNLEKIVKSILKWSHEFKNQMRLKCRHILDRLARRLGLEAVAKVTPEEHAKLIANMRKRDQRSKRSKAAASAGNNDDDDDEIAEATANASATAAGKKSFGNAYEDVLYGSESELEDSDEEGEDSRSKAKAGSKAKNAKSKAKSSSAGGDEHESSGSARKTAGAWIKEDADGPLDFLDRSAFTHFATADPTSAKARRMPTVPKMKDGKLLFEDPEEEERKAKAKAKAEAMATDEDGAKQGVEEDYYLESLTSKDGYYRAANQKIKFRKRKAGDEDNDVEMASDNEGAVPSKKPEAAKHGGKGRRDVAYGREFKAKKAKGDVKRGNVDPFAYIPLNPKAMKMGAVGIKGNSKKEKRMRNMK